MIHWTNKYLSIPYKKMHCSKFCEYVLKDHFGIEFSFPQSEGTIFNQSEQIKKNIPKFTCYPIKTDYPNEGDLVLMHGMRRMCHVGLYVEIKQVGYVLHSEASLGSACLNKIRDLKSIGYSLEGIYRWQR